MGAVSSEDKQLKIVKGGYHELLHGPEKADVMRDVLSWVNSHSALPITPNL